MCALTTQCSYDNCKSPNFHKGACPLDMYLCLLAIYLQLMLKDVIIIGMGLCVADLECDLAQHN